MKPRLLLIVVCCLLVALPITPSDAAAGDKRTLEDGLKAFYQSDWKQASSIFKDLQKTHPNDPKAYFFEAMIPFWHYFYGEKGSEAAERFLKLSEQAINVSERRLKKTPNDTSAVLMLSGLYGYRSMVAATEKEYTTAIKSGMTGFTYTRQVLQMDDHNDEALMGKGIYQYIMGSIPKEGKWVMNIMGMQGDIQQGFKDLERAAQSPRFSSLDAKMMLVYLYHREKRYQDAFRISSRLIKTYPDNIIFQYHHAKTLEQLGRNKEALKVYAQITDMSTELSAIQKLSQEKVKSLMP